MYGFRITYDNMETGKTREKLLEIDEQWYETPKDIYISAMIQSYNSIGADEMLAIVEYLYSQMVYHHIITWCGVMTT